jgi:hypothetical protein
MKFSAVLFYDGDKWVASQMKPAQNERGWFVRYFFPLFTKAFLHILTLSYMDSHPTKTPNMSERNYQLTHSIWYHFGLISHPILFLLSTPPPLTHTTIAVVTVPSFLLQPQPALEDKLANENVPHLPSPPNCVTCLACVGHNNRS